jgi:hypothetical protein
MIRVKKAGNTAPSELGGCHTSAKKLAGASLTLMYSPELFALQEIPV